MSGVSICKHHPIILLTPLTRGSVHLNFNLHHIRCRLLLHPCHIFLHLMISQRTDFGLFRCLQNIYWWLYLSYLKISIGGVLTCRVWKLPFAFEWEISLRFHFAIDDSLYHGMRWLRSWYGLIILMLYYRYFFLKYII